MSDLRLETPLPAVPSAACGVPGTVGYRGVAARATAASVLMLALMLAMPSRADAQAPGDAEALRVATLAATCAACHGTEGRPIEGGALPGLAGRPAASLAAELRAFRDGQRPATVMHQIARGYDDRQIDALAAWFAARPPEARP